MCVGDQDRIGYHSVTFYKCFYFLSEIRFCDLKIKKTKQFFFSYSLFLCVI